MVVVTTAEKATSIILDFDNNDYGNRSKTLKQASVDVDSMLTTTV
jgi:hypothetical protein